MGVPQFLVITIYAMALGLYLAKHDQPYTGTYNFFTALKSCAFLMLLLWWGGFFG